MTAGRAGRDIAGDIAGSGLALRTEMAVPTIGAAGLAETKDWDGGEDVSPAGGDAGDGAAAGAMANKGPLSSIVLGPPSHDGCGSGGPAATG